MSFSSTHRDFPEFLKISTLEYEELGHNAITINETETLYIIEGPLIRLLSEVLSFKFDILLPPDGQYGKVLKDGTWTGMMGMVDREEADIAVGELAISESRLAVVDFSYPYHYSPVTFITDKPKYLPNKYAILEPFTLSMWIAVVTSLVLIMFLAYVLRSKNTSAQSLLLDIYGSLLEQAVELKRQKLSTRILVSLWVIGAMFITFSYKAVLLSSLTFPTATGIRDIDQLAKATEEESFKCATYPGSYIYPTLLNAEDPVSRKIGECMRRDQDLFTGNFEKFLGNKMYSKAFLGIKSELISLRKGYFISDDSFFTSQFGIAVRKTFCCRELLDEAIHKMASFGLLDKLDREKEFFYALPKSYLTADESGSIRKLSLVDITGALIFLACGYVLSSAVLAVEVCFGRKRR